MGGCIIDVKIYTTQNLKPMKPKVCCKKREVCLLPPTSCFFGGYKGVLVAKAQTAKKILASNPLYEIVSALTFHKYLIGQRQISKLLLLHIDIILNLNSFLSKTLNVVDQVSHVVGWPPSAWQYGGNKGSAISGVS